MKGEPNEENFLEEIFSGIKIGSSSKESKKIFRTGANPAKKLNSSRGPLVLDVFKITKDASFKDIFSHPDNWSNLYLSPGQIASFCRTNKDKLSKNKTFFLTKILDQFFIAIVEKNGQKYLCTPNCKGVWIADPDNENFVVLPQVRKRNNK